MYHLISLYNRSARGVALLAELNFAREYFNLSTGNTKHSNNF